MASLWDLGPVIFGPLVPWLQNKGLLANSRTCSCGVTMWLGKRGDVSDGRVWRCPQCKTTKSIREGSFFSKSRMLLKKWLLLLHFWVRQYPVNDASQEAQVDNNTACDVYRWFRKMCSTTLLNTTITLGGPGMIVQVDESLFRHKPKVK